jgi:F-type H+-transporting ATPase subunit b
MSELLSQLPEPMQPNISILMIAILFLVLVVILNQLIFKPLVAVLDERALKIQEGEQAAQQAQVTVTERMEKYRAEKILARQQAQADRQRVLAEVEQSRSQMVDEAKAAARAVSEKSAAEIMAQVERAKQSLAGEARGMADRIAANILSRA